MDRDTETEMKDYLDGRVCPNCETGKMSLTGTALYTGPLIWGWKCGCGASGTVGWDSLGYKEIRLLVAML